VPEQQQLPPTVMKALLGHELARQRELAGMTQVDVAGVLGGTQQKIAHIEAGRGVKPLDLEALLDHYGADETDRAYAMDLYQEGRRRTKRGAFSTRFRQHLRLLVDMEPTCRTYCTYNSMVIPGLLQTEDYMRALFRVWRPSPTPEQIDRDTTDRLARQRVLDDTDRQFWFIIDEAALRCVTGSPTIMAAQITRLAEAIDRPNIDLQVVPFSVGYYLGRSSDYTIFGYAVRTPVSIVYVEHYDAGGEYISDRKRTDRFLTLWDQQKAAAIGPEQTRRMLLDLASSF